MSFLTAQEPPQSSSFQPPQPCRRFTISEIEIATRNFDDSLVVGSGGFGKVYRGTITNNNGESLLDVAIKRLGETSNQGAVEFRAEIEMLSNLRHCHLVSMIGYCNDGQEMVLVYQYMSRGTLEHHLHKRGLPLSWMRRLKICIGATRGLNYLHTGTGIKHGIIHRDVKSSNILLDDCWEAKIADFGLSKIGPTNQPCTSVSTMVKGTFGYLDPDYVYTGRLTRKSDVYAFGVVMLEVLCGKQAVDRSLGEEQWSLARWAQESIKEGKLNQIVDVNLRGRISPKCLKEFARLADSCLQSHLKHRPMMAEVVMGLESVLALQEKSKKTLQPSGMTVFGREVPKLISPSNREHSVGGISLKSLDIYLYDVESENRTLSRFDVDTINVATKNFSNTIFRYPGEELYKGRLQNGQDIAVHKQRCCESCENYENKMKEASTLFYLEHKNLVELLGYCIAGKELYFVYNFAPYRRLEDLIYDSDRAPLHWDEWYKILLGVAQALVYLHKHPPIRAHPRVDLGNIWLDESLVPKLSGFGHLRCFKVYEPDYIDVDVFHQIGGDKAPESSFLFVPFSTKVDVFSFGFLVLQVLFSPPPITVLFEACKHLGGESIHFIVAVALHIALEDGVMVEPTFKNFACNRTSEKMSLSCHRFCMANKLPEGFQISNIVDALFKTCAPILTSQSLGIMENNFQPTLQQQLAAAQQQIQQLANQNMEANNEIVRLRGLNPQVSQTNPAISAPLPRPPPIQQNQFRTPQVPSMPQASQIPVMTQVSQNNVRLPQNNQSQTIFPPLPSGPPPVFTYVQPQGVPRPFYSIPEPIPHIPTINTTVTHIPIQPNYQGNIGVTPTENLMDVRLKMLEEQNKAMLALLAKLPGAAVPVEVEPKTGFQASPYVDEIALMEIPKKYNIPAFTTKYLGITDPVEHVAQYKQLMWTASIPSQYQEACMCKSFGSTLTGAALQWLINLKPKSIESFAELVNQFTRQFASSRKMEKQTSDLYYVVQKTGETIRDYFNRFNAEMIEVKNCDIKTAIEAYKRGLDNSSELYTDLTKYPPENFDDVRARTLAHMRIEDDAIFRRKHSNEKKNLGAQKHDFKPKRVNKIGNSRQESKTRTSKGTGRIRYPDLSTYNFAGTSKELVDSLRKIDANVRWPKKPENPSKDKDQTKWCEFHADHGHTTDECISLKKEIAYLKTNGHLKGIIGDEAKRPASPIHTKVVNCITGGSEVCGLTYSAAKRHAREGPEGYPIPEDSKTAAEKELDTAKLTFDQDDLSGVNQKHHDALVIQLTIGNCLTKRVLVDGGSSANVIFSDTLKIMGIDRSNIVRRTTTLVGFNGDATSTLGEIILPVFAKGINKQTKFNVIDCPSAYNAILGRPWIHDMKAVPSTYHQKIKFPSPWGVQEIVSEKKIAHCFAWSHEDMVGIDPDIISHKLNVDPSFKPIKQKRRKFAPERNKVINDEVDNLLKTGKIREVKYPDWLANVVVVQKKNGKWRVCIDFTDLNKACPKDPFPLPHIDAMVDATAGHELLTFMDAYSGYNQILMHADDQEKTAFMTDKGIYCYKVMPFGLKNAGSTYQRLVNMMFKEHLGRTMEVYIDDMLVKSERSHDHIDHLKQSFDILRQYKMKLNPTKCSFGVRAGKFLGYMVTQRGIEASPEQIKAIQEIQSPRNVKEVQKLTGRVAALNRFISRSSDKCHLFYNVLRKNQGFNWTEAHEKALQDLKQYMASPPLLTKPIEGESLQLYLAVSNNAVSAVLVREDDQQQHPIYYISKSFLNAETRYTSMEKLLLGLVTAAKKLRHYFESHHIIVVTNYPLKTVLRKPELTGRLAKWSIYLSGFDLTYKPRTAIKSQALADFVAEFSPEVEQPSHDEINNVMIQDNQLWTLYVDGSSNIRGSGLGIVLKSSHGGNMVYSIRCEFKATNNEAEYEALIAGLEIAYNSGARCLHVRSDSLLVVNQINGDFQAKDSKMMVYLEIAKESIARFEKFSIEQIPRDLNVQADALANLGSAFNEPTLENIPIIHLTMSSIETKEKVQMIEEVYNWSLDIWNYLKYDKLPDDKMEARKTKVKASRYTIFEGKLYRKSTSGLILRCITSQKHMNQILQEMHDGECGNHSGGRSLANRISRQGYYWPTLREDAMRYVQKCDACQKHSGMSHLPSEPLHSVLIPWPFMRWGMDIVGKLPPAPGQKVYLLVLTDYFSKWIEAAAFSQVRDKEVISFIQTNIIYRFGVPSEIMCDNGSQFISERTRKFCDERGIRLITSTPRYPHSNGLAESSNKVIINSIRKRLKEAKGRWVEELPSVLWANRTTPRTSTGQTPFSLVYGCEALLPIESQLPIARHRTMDQNVINLYYDLDALEELREKAFQKMALQKAMVERHFNRKVKAKIFQVGDYVLRQVFQNTQELNAGKLSIKWEGPYIISKIIGNGAYKLTNIEGKEIPRSWNATHLKRYYF
ncbi:hypothetical protein OSB04_031073 [Centaurea solstitialis]|uniref:Uncharacterized protein n=1 Tax=Centaurea solstitialis TaxID=347529 RepID=A0AA38W4E2_9ASTR|nr:hypothetical protein OSB04_031073 [Centaurea solstitialis]